MVQSQVGSKCLVLCSVLSAQCHSVTVPQCHSATVVLSNVLGELDCILGVREPGMHRRHHRRIVPAAVFGEPAEGDGVSEA